MQSVGPLLHERRRARRLTLAQLAQRVDATPSYLSMIENQRVDNPPSAGLLQRLEEALGITDGALQQAAQWQATPDTVRRTVAQLADDAQRGRKLAAWLKSQTDHDRKHGGKDLDALYRSGQLSKRINAVLAEPSTPDTPAKPGQKSGEVSGGASGGDVFTLLRNAPRIPLINKVAAGNPSTFTDLDFPPGIADDYVAVPGLTDPDAFATRITGSSMQPQYVEGDIVVFAPSAEVTDGCDAFVRLESDHEITFKRVYFDAEQSTIRLQPLNPDFPARVVPREAVAGMFRAVWRFAKL